MNIMPKIAEMLGVELGEEFKINPLSGVYKLDEGGLLNKHKDGKWYGSGYLSPLLTGQYKIEKIPFQPRCGQNFYKVVIRDGELIVVKETWANWLADYADKYCGNCFRTEAEAGCEKYNIYKRLTGEEWGE